MSIGFTYVVFLDTRYLLSDTVVSFSWTPVYQEVSWRELDYLTSDPFKDRY